MSISTIMKKSASIAAVAAIAVMALPTSTSAWYVNHSASSMCKDEQATISWSFKNTEPNKDKYSMDIIVTNSENDTRDTRTVAPGETVTGNFATYASQIDAGKVTFEMLWTDGRSGVDTRHSKYSATEECYVAEEPAFDATVVCSVVDMKAAYTLTVTQTAGDVDGVFTPANGAVLENGDAVEVTGVFTDKNNNTVKKVVTAEAASDCTPQQPKEIEVCRDGAVITIAEDERLESDTDAPCPEVKGETTELPKTGAGSMLALLGSTFVGGTVVSQLRLRRK